VDVGRTARVPDERGPFQLPDVPHAIAAQIVLAVKGQGAAVEPPVGRKTGDRFVAIRVEGWLATQAVGWLPQCSNTLPAIE